MKYTVTILMMLLAACSSIPPQIESENLSNVSHSQAEELRTLEQAVMNDFREKQQVEKNLREKRSELATLPDSESDKITSLRAEIETGEVKLELREARLAESIARLELKKAEIKSTGMKPEQRKDFIADYRAQLEDATENVEESESELERVKQELAKPDSAQGGLRK